MADEKVIEARMKHLIRTEAEWKQEDPVLLLGELGVTIFRTTSTAEDIWEGTIFEGMNLKKREVIITKIGDGVKKYSELGYMYDFFSLFADLFAKVKNHEERITVLEDVPVVPFTKSYWIHKDTGAKTEFETGEVFNVKPTWLADAKEIFIGDEVKEIGDMIIESAPKLVKCVISDSVIKIGDSFLRDCPLLLALEIPDTVLKLGKMCALNCSQLKNLQISNSLKTIEDYCFSNTGITVANIPESVTRIESSCFYGCVVLDRIVLPSKLEHIGNASFSDIFSIKRITSKSPTPPILSPMVFKGLNNPTPAKIYVPAQSVQAYKDTAGWSPFADIIEAI